MSILTPFFNLIKPAKTDPTAISQLNSNMDTIDTEMHRPPLTVNETEPDEDRNIIITTVPLADNLTSDEAQINIGTYIIRTTGGESSIADGPAWLSDIRGEMIKTGFVNESIDMTVNAIPRESGDPITATIDRDVFVEAVSSSGTITLTYTTDWSADPETYGITVSGTPVSGDQIIIVYVKGNRGTITTATPISFISTGWNLYNHVAGYARVVNYSNEFGFMIEGTYTSLAFAETLSGQQTPITPVDGYFTIPASNGFVFVTGGNATDTMIWMTWADWIDEANGGVFEPYSQTSIDLSGVMVNFPNGLMRIANYYDEINLNTQAAYSRIERMAYTDENLESVIASGVPYDTDTNYIYAVRIAPVTYSISLSGEYTASDHGMEMFIGTNVPVYSSSLYGQDLKGKLRRDVLTISQQTLTPSQKVQVQNNIGLSLYDISNNDTPVSLEVVKSSLLSLAGQMSAIGQKSQPITILCIQSPFDTVNWSRAYGTMYVYDADIFTVNLADIKTRDVKLAYIRGTWYLTSLSDQVANKISKVGEFTVPARGSVSFSLPGDGVYIIAGHGSVTALNNVCFLIGGYATASRCNITKLTDQTTLTITGTNTSSLTFTASNSNGSSYAMLSIIKMSN